MSAEITAQIVLLLLEDKPDPEKGYYGICIEAADIAYRIHLKNPTPQEIEYWRANIAARLIEGAS